MKYTPPLNEEEDASYVNGDPSTGLTGSIIPAGALENPQREIVNTITSAGLTPSASSNAQLAQAVSTLINNSASALQTQIEGKQATVTGAATTITGSNLTASRALVSNSSGKVAVSDTTATELNYVHGVTSAIQTQLNNKQASITGAATTITGSNLTASRALVSNSSGKVAVSDTTATELNYVHGVTSAIQTQLNNKQTANDVSTAITNMLKTLFPVGSIYIGTQSTCPLATLISGSTWTLVGQNRALWGGDGSNANSNISAGLPNITGAFNQQCLMNWTDTYARGALYQGTVDNQQRPQNAGGTDGGNNLTIAFDASKSNSIYGKSSTVQPPAYRVNVWRRTK